MCLRWANDFNEFLKDMGRCPKGYTLDRIDNDGNYDPENCRWASYYEQSRNKRNNHWIEYNGENLILTDWAKKIRIPPKTLHSKLKTMTMEEIIKSLSNSSQSKGGTV